MNAIPVQGRRKPLFARLLLYFSIVLIVPLGLFSAYYALSGGKSQERYLKDQALSLVQSDALTVGTILETYRHKAYQLSTDDLVVEIMKQDDLDANSPVSRKLYEFLFSIMRGDTYLASANLVSNSGKVRLSTHTFPDVFDLRYHGNDWDVHSIIGQNAEVSPTASIISLQGHRVAENGKQVIASILRRIYDDEGKNLGYLVIEIYIDALEAKVNLEQTWSDLLLVDGSAFQAASLLHPQRYGSFANFTTLNTLEGDYSQRAIRSGTDIAAATPLQGTTLALVGIISSVPFEQNLDRWLSAFTITMGIGVLLAIGLSLLFSRSISIPIQDLAQRMKEVEQGHLATEQANSPITEFAQLEHSFNIMVGQIRSLLELTREEQAKLNEAERKALESQMNPHFLFNTLNTIKALARLHGEEDIYTITVKLGKLLRSTIDNHESECTLKESMELIDSYLTIQRLRFGEKLKTTTYLDPGCADIKTPKLIIQPLVENAIIHGLEPKIGEWVLSVKVERHNGRIFICIVDNGVGFPPDRLPQDLNELANSTHVGVYNVYRRLSLNYGRNLTFSLQSQEGVGTTVKISFPDDAAEKGSTR